MPLMCWYTVSGTAEGKGIDKNVFEEKAPQISPNMMKNINLNLNLHILSLT